MQIVTSAVRVFVARQSDACGRRNSTGRGYAVPPTWTGPWLRLNLARLDIESAGFNVPAVYGHLS